MKILYVLPWLYRGGAERMVLETCIELIKNKNLIVKVICFKPDNSYQKLSKKIDWQIIPASINLSITKKNILNIYELNKFINEYEPDIIHTHLWEAEIITRHTCYSKAKWFTHFHDKIKQLNNTFVPTSKKELTNLYERKLIIKKFKQLNNNFICISQDTYRYAKNVLPKSFHQNIHILPNAINFNNFFNKIQLDINEIKLIYVGRIDINKNQKFAIDIVKILVNKEPKVKITFLGDGQERKNLIYYAKKLGVENNVTFLGIKENVNEILWQHNIYLHTALSEGFGITLIEAMAAGLPVVSLDGKGNRDFINHKENGYIFKKEDPKLFADCIIKLYTNKKLYQKISLNGQRTAEKYDIKIYTEKLLELYNL